MGEWLLTDVSAMLVFHREDPALEMAYQTEGQVVRLILPLAVDIQGLP